MRSVLVDTGVRLGVVRESPEAERARRNGRFVNDSGAGWRLD